MDSITPDHQKDQVIEGSTEKDTILEGTMTKKVEEDYMKVESAVTPPYFIIEGNSNSFDDFLSDSDEEVETELELNPAGFQSGILEGETARAG